MDAPFGISAGGLGAVEVIDAAAAVEVDNGGAVTVEDVARFRVDDSTGIELDGSGGAIDDAGVAEGKWKDAAVVETSAATIGFPARIEPPFEAQLLLALVLADWTTVPGSCCEKPLTVSRTSHGCRLLDF